MNLTGTILIANNDRLTTEFFDIFLSKLKFEVIKATDGLNVLNKIKKYQLDLILIEDVLPKFNGIEITKKIRRTKEFKEYKNLPIIIISTNDNPKEKVLAFENGADDFISRPFNFSEVLARIRTVLRHKELSNQIIRREKRLAILDSLTTNLISFTTHIKKPLSSLYKDLNKLNFDDNSSIKNFIKKFEDDYNEMNGMLKGLEEQIKEFKCKKDYLKREELSIIDLEKKIDKHIKLVK